jgi:hypothetical protein
VVDDRPNDGGASEQRVTRLEDGVRLVTLRRGCEEGAAVAGADADLDAQRGDAAIAWADPVLRAVVALG